jgi:conjugative transfer signal peptidase TraF
MIMRSAFGAVAATMTLLSFAQASGFRLNMTPSIPEGIYVSDPKPPGRGDLVLVCPPDTPFFRGARANGYLFRGRCPGGYVPLMKPIAAVEGDIVDVSPAGIRVNGVALANTRAFSSDAHGNLLPHPKTGRHVVEAGEMWLLSSYDQRSIDSRYFGPLSIAGVETVVRPVLVQGGNP